MVERKAGKVTIWRRYSYKENGYIHNHIEDGWSDNPKPEPKSEAQQAWNHYDWERIHGVIKRDGKLIKTTLPIRSTK